MASTDNTLEIDKLADKASATINASQVFGGIDFDDQTTNSVTTIHPINGTLNGFNAMGADIGSYSYRYDHIDEKEAKLQADCRRLKLVEMQQVDGTKLLKLVRFTDLLNVREVKVKDPSGQLVTAVQFESKEESGTFTIACDLAAFARLFGLDYERFSIAVMETTIEGD